MTDNNAVVAATSTKIEIFNNPSFGNIRAFADENGEPWFVAADVARVLGYDHTPHATRLLDDDEADVHKVDSRSVNGVEQAREVSIINESGLYHLVLMSKKPEAKKFRKWVTVYVKEKARLIPRLTCMMHNASG